MPSLQQLLTKREGCEEVVYLDSLKKPTVGIGHLVVPADKLKVGDKVTPQQISAFFKKDSAKAVSAARSQAAKANIKDGQFIVYLSSVNFQLGTRWTSVFKDTWQLILDGEYEKAAVEVGKSRWAKQTPKRSKDFQAALRKLPAKAADQGASGSAGATAPRR